MPLPDRLQRLMIASSSELGHTLTVIKAFRIYVPKSNPRNHWLTLLLCQHLNVNKNLSIHFDRFNEAATFSTIQGIRTCSCQIHLAENKVKSLTQNQPLPYKIHNVVWLLDKISKFFQMTWYALLPSLNTWSGFKIIGWLPHAILHWSPMTWFLLYL